MVATRIKPFLAEQARQVQLDAGKYGADGGRGNKKDEETLPQNFGEGFCMADKKEKHNKESNTQAAKQVGNTNAEYVRQAEKLVKDAPEVAKQVFSYRNQYAAR